MTGAGVVIDQFSSKQRTPMLRVGVLTYLFNFIYRCAGGGLPPPLAPPLELKPSTPKAWKTK